ncbi:glycosyltransferase family 2 protein [Paenibacillus sp. GM2]|uniref:glycosyltransferase family 2 protein n=1 Tax=Paenibacillus sp. GM2 TaxID=1622070 RepID=UPI0008388D26|nr:glycosyltransferase family 2 protein [Paenibacillus sp. GM2]
MPTVSVQIVTYNSSADIVDCLSAVLAQTHKLEQIIVIDNASADDTVEQVRSMIMKEQVSIKLVENTVNTGFAPAHNQALSLSSSDYALVLNPDVRLQPDYIEQIISYMEEEPQMGGATGLLLRQPATDTVDSTGLVLNSIWRAFDRGAGDQAEKWKQSGSVFGPSGAAAIYRRTMIEDISVQGQFFDEDFFAYKEDVDVAWRAQLLGWKSYYCAGAVGYHKRGWKKGGRSSQPLFIRRKSYINRYKMIYKNLSGLSWLKSLPKFLVYEIAANGYFLLREPKVLGAWWELIIEIPRLKEKRNEVKGKQRIKRETIEKQK